MIIDYIRVAQPYGVQVSVAVKHDGLILNTQSLAGSLTESPEFSDYPELRSVYKDGWDLDELKALVERLPLGGS